MAQRTQVYWGDTHLHTKLSLDAYRDGNKSLGPAMAYRFARGDVVSAHNGMKVRIRRPLDFLVVADHAEGLGVMAGLEMADSLLLATEAGKGLHARYQAIEAAGLTGTEFRLQLHRELVNRMRGDGDVRDIGYRQTIWQRVTSTADEYYEPGKFTTFSGFEWTVNTHRVVIFKDAADKVNEVLPFSQHDSSNPEDLWQYLANYERRTKGEALAIPHNPNVSSGTAFSVVDSDGNPLDRVYAVTRARWEPLLEVTQIKGDSETHPLLSPTDEFADYERWDFIGSLNPDLQQHNYARSALKLGLEQQAGMGVNPFKFGMIGSTDAHTSLSTADESNFWGNMTLGEPYANRMLERTNTISQQLSWKYAASGYAGVWAEANTREAIFAAMKRKETFATTGPRITVRFFGGWDYEDKDSSSPDLARIGYTKGVPMGGDLANATEGRSPAFLIQAVRDPDGANLDRIQVIKGWRDNEGGLHENIYDVALADGRKASQAERAPFVGNTVTVEDASYTNSIGAPELAIVWQDPLFRAEELAFYYVRVLEIPTPRWTAYDAKFFGVEDTSSEIPMVTQERAYTSPIWYTPALK